MHIPSHFFPKTSSPIKTHLDTATKIKPNEAPAMHKYETPRRRTKNSKRQNLKPPLLLHFLEEVHGLQSSPQHESHREGQTERQQALNRNLRQGRVPHAVRYPSSQAKVDEA
ncbi:Rho GTPase-activating protein 11A [Striga asiatica]|uniref:Rho GTPase-activating protein 11A n=1 Tax=Striga asiatica TaxID=4170 RepID=A0A5A7QJP5_STRAF|nr:Rho GTPase-activating protein 11A [Striga asiatica]